MVGISLRAYLYVSIYVSEHPVKLSDEACDRKAAEQTVVGQEQWSEFSLKVAAAASRVEEEREVLRQAERESLKKAKDLAYNRAYQEKVDDEQVKMAQEIIREELCRRRDGQKKLEADTAQVSKNSSVCTAFTASPSKP